MTPPPRKEKAREDEQPQRGTAEWVAAEAQKFSEALERATAEIAEGRRTREHHPMRREEDTSTIAAISAVYRRWQPVMTAIVFLLLAVGFDFKTPRALFEGIERKQERGDSAISARIDRIEARQDASFNDREDLRALLEAIVRYDCIRGEPDQVKLAGLPCARVLESREDDLVKRGARAPGEPPR